MTTAIQRRRGTTAQHVTFIGLDGEITVDSTKHTLVVHDGVTPGGQPLQKETTFKTVGGSNITGTGDIPIATTATAISNTPAGNIIAVTVQDAINELDGEKQAVLVSGTSIKTINNASILGAGNITTVQLLDDLTDVVITTPTHGQVLKYDSVSSLWKNDTVGGGGSVTLADIHNAILGIY